MHVDVTVREFCTGEGRNVADTKGNREQNKGRDGRMRRPIPIADVYRIKQTLEEIKPRLFFLNGTLYIDLKCVYF